MRASDAERELVVDRLTRALARGRLTLAEYEERAAAAYAAVHREDLDRLVGDLPGRLW